MLANRTHFSSLIISSLWLLSACARSHETDGHEHGPDPYWSTARAPGLEAMPSTNQTSGPMEDPPEQPPTEQEGPLSVDPMVEPGSLDDLTGGAVSNGANYTIGTCVTKANMIANGAAQFVSDSITDACLEHMWGVKTSAGTTEGNGVIVFNENTYTGMKITQSGHGITAQIPGSNIGAKTAYVDVTWTISQEDLFRHPGFPKAIMMLGNTTQEGHRAHEDRTGYFFGMQALVETVNGIPNTPYIDVFVQNMAPKRGGPVATGVVRSARIRLPDPVEGVYSIRLEVTHVIDRANRRATVTLATGASDSANDPSGLPPHTTWVADNIAGNNDPVWVTLGSYIGRAWRGQYDKTSMLGGTFTDANFYLSKERPTTALIPTLPEPMATHCAQFLKRARTEPDYNSTRPLVHDERVYGPELWRPDLGLPSGDNEWVSFETDGTSLIILHHFGGPANSPGFRGPYTYGNCRNIVRGVFQHHAYTLRWGDIGYHEVQCGEFTFLGRIPPTEGTCNINAQHLTPEQCNTTKSNWVGGSAIGYNGYLNSSGEYVNSYGIAITDDHRFGHQITATNYYFASCRAAVVGYAANVPTHYITSHVRSPNGADDPYQVMRESMHNPFGNCGRDCKGHTTHGRLNNTACPGDFLPFSQRWACRNSWLTGVPQTPWICEYYPF